MSDQEPTSVEIYEAGELDLLYLKGDPDWVEMVDSLLEDALKELEDD